MENSVEPNEKFVVGTFPGLSPRLIRPLAARETLREYQQDGGYHSKIDPSGLLDAINESGIRGRGGAAFPLGTKMTAVRASCTAGVRPVVIANGEEGEPASVKDRWLLRYRPHLVLDGLRLAAAVVGADRAVVYVSDPAAATAVEEAVGELRDAGLFDLQLDVVTVVPAYVAGEESAAVRAVNGGPALPTDKPPRVFEIGVDGLPTLVSNVETLANLPFVQQHGAQAYREVGTSGSPGTCLVTVNIAGSLPGLYEIPQGIPFRELLALHGVNEQDVTGVLMGGYFAGLFNQRIFDATLDHESLRGMGAGLGCGSVNLMTRDECPVAVGAAVMKYFDRENAGQCGSCFNGTAAMSAALDALRDGVASSEDLARLDRWADILRKRGACGTLDGATNIARTVLDEFPESVSAHMNRGCENCSRTTYMSDRPFEVEAVSLV